MKGDSTSCSSLDGSNYDYWKELMTTYIKSIDVQARKAAIYRYTPPMKYNAKGNKVPKEEAELITAEEAIAIHNSRAINVILNGVDPIQDDLK